MAQWEDDRLIFITLKEFTLELRVEPGGGYRWWELVGSRWCETSFKVNFDSFTSRVLDRWHHPYSKPEPVTRAAKQFMLLVKAEG